MSSGSKKKSPNMRVWVKPKLHTHRDCGLRFLPLLHTFYIWTIGQPPYVKMSSEGIMSGTKTKTTLDCVLLKDRSLVFVVWTSPRNQFSSLIRPHHFAICYASSFFIFLLTFCLQTPIPPRTAQFLYIFEQNRLLRTSQRFNFTVLQHVQGPNTALHCAG